MSWLFWVLAAALTAVVALFLLRPLLKSTAADDDATGGEDLLVYRAQLLEIDRDLERGVLAPTEAKAARLEIERRLLAADSRNEKIQTGLTQGMTRLVALGLLVTLPLFALGLYLWLGQPDMPDQPLAERGEEVQEQRDIAEMVQGLRMRLEDNPDDRDGWEMLGRSYGVLGRWEETIDAYRKALELSDEPRPALQSALGEALVTVNQGEVDTDAERAFDTALEADPQDARARFYKALALDQRGESRDALERWIDLAEDTPQDAGWRPMLMQQIAATAQELGLDPEIMGTGSESANRTTNEPSVQDMERDEQEAYIRSMVDGLDARLQDNPEDPEGWLRLAQARLVLEEPDAAAQALEEARRQIDRLPSDAAERDALQRALETLEQRL